MHVRQASLLLLLTACARAPTVSITPTKDAPSVSSKPDTCEIEFFAIDALQRPHDALGEVRVSFGTSYPSPYSSLTPEKEEMRRQACLLGADAIIGLHEAVGLRREEVEGEHYAHEYSSYTLIGTAVRYRR